MATLWQLSRDYERLRAKLAALEGELDEQTEAQLDELQGDIQSKVRRIALVREAVVEELTVATEWAKRTAERKAGLVRELDRLERYMAHHLGKLGMEVELPATDTTPPVTYSAKLTPGRTIVPPGTIGKLPKACLTFVPAEVRPDLRTVRQMLEAGVEMPEGVRVVREHKLVVR